jgi:predicted Zn-dependent protease
LVKRNSRYIILGMLILCLVVLETTYYLGKEFNQEKQTDFENYTYAIQLIQAKQSDRAIVILKTLDEKYPENIYIYKYLGLAYTQEGDAKTGLTYFQEMLTLNPIVELDPSFMLQYGEVLYYNEKYKEAEVVLETAINKGNVGTFKEQMTDLLSKIKKKATIKG